MWIIHTLVASVKVAFTVAQAVYLLLFVSIVNHLPYPTVGPHIPCVLTVMKWRHSFLRNEFLSVEIHNLKYLS